VAIDFSKGFLRYIIVEMVEGINENIVMK